MTEGSQDLSWEEEPAQSDFYLFFISFFIFSVHIYDSCALNFDFQFTADLSRLTSKDARNPSGLKQ
jgi:hypothetical protein